MIRGAPLPASGKANTNFQRERGEEGKKFEFPAVCLGWR